MIKSKGDYAILVAAIIIPFALWNILFSHTRSSYLTKLFFDYILILPPVILAGIRRGYISGAIIGAIIYGIEIWSMYYRTYIGYYVDIPLISFDLYALVALGVLSKFLYDKLPISNLKIKPFITSFLALWCAFIVVNFSTFMTWYNKLHHTQRYYDYYREHITFFFSFDGIAYQIGYSLIPVIVICIIVSIICLFYKEK